MVIGRLLKNSLKRLAGRIPNGGDRSGYRQPKRRDNTTSHLAYDSATYDARILEA